MRLKSELWVKAYLRRCRLDGADALLVRRGDTDAGAIYIKVSRLDGTAMLFGPAPAGLDEAREDRRWQPCLKAEPVAESVPGDAPLGTTSPRRNPGGPDLVRARSRSRR